METEEEFVGCISCMGTKDLCDLFGAYAANAETYAKLFENCFNIKVSGDLKYLCSDCVEKLEKCVCFKEQTVKNISMLRREEEYLDESILEEAEKSEKQEEKETEDTDKSEKADNSDQSDQNLQKPKKVQKVVIIRKQGDKDTKKDSDSDSNDEFDADGLDANGLDADEQAVMKAIQDTQCMYCSIQLGSREEARAHITAVHGLHPSTGQSLASCHACFLPVTDLQDHLNRCHGVKSEQDGREFPCHFCENIYSTRKACFTHLRMKHGLKLYNDQSIKSSARERKKCHLCSRDFSQKQILNKHLWKAHGIEVEKRKAFLCPLCTERVSYGSHFSAHLLHQHRLHEQVEQLEFTNMDEFKTYKTAIQEQTKYRFRKTTSSKPTIDGLRSHYMCSQSGIYIYQGKGKRPAPERQIYKTGKACPAHMIVTETMERVLVTFYKTHVGHGLCPYYEPRECKKPKMETIDHHSEMSNLSNSLSNQQPHITYDDNHSVNKHHSNPRIGYSDNHGKNNHSNQQLMTYNDNHGKNNHSNQQLMTYNDNHGKNNHSNQQLMTYNDNHGKNNHSNQQLMTYNDNHGKNNHSNQQNAMSQQLLTFNDNHNKNKHSNQQHMSYSDNHINNHSNHYNDNQQHMAYSDNHVMNNHSKKHNVSITYTDNHGMSNHSNQQHMTYNDNHNHVMSKHSNQQHVTTYENHVIDSQQHISYNDLFKNEVMHDDDDDAKCVQIESSLAWICDTCGMGFLDVEQFKRHITSHGPKLFPCQYCESVFENIDAWTRHIQVHGAETIY